MDSPAATPPAGLKGPRAGTRALVTGAAQGIGRATAVRLAAEARLEDVDGYDVAVAGVPFGAGVTFRPGARFGPSYIPQASRLLRPCNPALDVLPFGRQQVVDAGDLPRNPAGR